MPHTGKLNFVLVGCGYIGKRHAGVLLQHPQCQLVALVDTDKNALSPLKHLNLPFFQSLDQCFTAQTETDIVIVATPNGTHAGLAIKALEQQKHVLIEKPMALTSADAGAIIKKANEVNRQVMVVLQNRYAPVSQWLKQMVTSGTLGKIFFVEVNCFWNRDERYYTSGSWHGSPDLDGGCLFTQFSHFVDSLYWLFGDIKNISSRFYNYTHNHLTSFEDTATIHFEFENGGAGCFNFSTSAWDRNLESSLTILAENGSIKVSGQYMDQVEFFHVKEETLPRELNEKHVPASNHYAMIDAMVNSVLQQTPTNAAEAFHTIDMIERMYASGVH